NASVHLDRLSPVQSPEQRAVRHAQLARALRMEAAESLVLDQRIAHGWRPVIRAEHANVVAVAGEHAARLQLTDPYRARHAVDTQVDRSVEDRHTARWPPQPHIAFAPLQPHRAHQADD